MDHQLSGAYNGAFLNWLSQQKYIHILHCITTTMNTSHVYSGRLKTNWLEDFEVLFDQSPMPASVSSGKARIHSKGHIRCLSRRRKRTWRRANTCQPICSGPRETSALAGGGTEVDYKKHYTVDWLKSHSCNPIEKPPFSFCKEKLIATLAQKPRILLMALS